MHKKSNLPKEELDIFEIINSEDQENNLKDFEKTDEDMYLELIKKGMKKSQAAHIVNKITETRLKYQYLI